MTSVLFYYVDSLGKSKYVMWSGPPSFSGTATGVIDTAESAGGAMRIQEIDLFTATATVNYYPGGGIATSPSGLKRPSPTTSDFAAAGVTIQSDVDLSVPPSLVWFERMSPGVVSNGDTVSVDWEVKDVPVTSVLFYYVDSLGKSKYVMWSGPPSFSGTATGVIDTAESAGGAMRIQEIDLFTATATVNYYPGGGIATSPSGLKRPSPTTSDFAAAGVTIQSDVDLSVPPSLVWFERMSPGVVSNGDTVSVDWEVKDVPVTSVLFYYVDSLGKSKYVMWSGPPSFSGTATGVIDTAESAGGAMRIQEIDLFTATATVNYYPGGGIATSPSGLKRPSPTTSDFAAAGVNVGPLRLSPEAVTFADVDGTEDDTYTVPETAGVEYLIEGNAVAAGTYPGSGTVTVTAKAIRDYILAEGAASEWTHEFKATPFVVTAAPVVFTDVDGTKGDTYTIPATEGIEYLVAGNVVAAGTYPGSGTVTVAAKAVTDYVLAESTASEWSHGFKATPFVVTPAPVTFTDVDGTKDDTYTIPATVGVEYLVGGNVVAAGKYPGSGTVTVTAKALTDYVLAAGAMTEWAHEFKATPFVVTPAPVAFTDADGTTDDTYTIPATVGVEYLVGGNVVAAGTYPGSGTVTVTAKALTDYVLAAGAMTEWAHEFKATPFVVTPAPVAFTDADGTTDDTYTIPATVGVEYLVGGNVVAAGKYPGSGTVTVTAKALTDYVLAAGAMTEWAHEFKATPFVVTPAPVAFTDADGTTDDTYTIPATEGVEYLVSGNVVAAGTYLGSGTVTVSAMALTDYVLAAGAMMEWSQVFKVTPFVVTPVSVVFSDVDGTKDDTYTIPATEGVEYLVGGNVVAAGKYPGSGTVTVTARALTDYVLAEGAVSEWSQVFKATPFVVTPAPVVFSDVDGTKDDTYTIPATEGVEYLVGGNVVAAGKYPGSGTVTVTAKALTDYVLAEGAVSEWSQVFKATPFVVTPAPVVFMDVDGAKDDTYTIPATEGVEYLVGGNVVAAGKYPGSGTVTVTAKALTDYVLAEGAVSEWSQVFKATPFVVTPAPVAFTDADGTTDDTYTIPATVGVEYLVGGNVVAAGTYPGSGTVTVTARALTDYVLAEGATSEWSQVFKATPFVVTPAPVTFTDVDGTKDDTYTVPATAGVEYLIAGNVIAAGTYPGSGTVTITSRAISDYVLAESATAEWVHKFKVTPFVVTPVPVTFADMDGTKDDTYTVPATAGVEYLVGGNVIAAGTYPGSGTVTVTARALTDYVLAEGATSEWSKVFKTTPAPVVFSDLPVGAQFFDEISWLSAQGISTGWTEADGSKSFRPVQAVNRDAMAAFMYRLAGSPAFNAPAVSPFADITPSTQFYKEITWLASQGISTGWVESNGSKTFRPVQPVNRDAMAAFMYRFAGKPAFVDSQVFVDVPPGAQFHAEISWLAGAGISTGWTAADGSKTFRPLVPVTRDAMAAFMYRYHQKYMNS
ncbi:S-layer homology domain-containing protein [Arthrobacter sp. StoSoilB22]|uniref:S-layer homology domain-containing protein n=1 Tax=Arthrobacter sp. StoSoilB22 TaxID=2830996 RepID=UPI001CC432D8|nr:S-layer homology domain-containing protein [Arthrobacter sp. StoSoilB22]